MLKSLYLKLTKRVSWSAAVEGKIGAGTKVWRWSHISRGAIVGNNCMIGAHVYIGPNVIIGDNVRIQNGVFIPEGWTIRDNVFIGPNTTFINHPSMCGGKEKWETGGVGDGAKIGAMCTIFPCIVRANTVVGARTLLMQDVNHGHIIHECFRGYTHYERDS